MGWGFRKSVKLMPGVRLNFSKSGVSTSIGGKGFTYNTRGRITASVPGTGIRYSTNTNAKRQSRSSVASLAASSGTSGLTKKEQDNHEFMLKLRGNTFEAVQDYFFSHGILADLDSYDEATAQEEHSELFASLEDQFETVSDAARMMNDVGTLSLASKEQAMRAAYAIEKALGAKKGATSGLKDAVEQVQQAQAAIPQKPIYVTLVIWTLILGGLCVGMHATIWHYAIVLPVLLIGVGKRLVYKHKLRGALRRLDEANYQLDKLSPVELSSRSMIKLE
ncbi:DUF4236 domain-containing protein [Silvimonas iriomotensis]|uniref:DUF4236 domain-containing protein n=1 Tax=Silvimonas iriomotensis TaxID=449662 RepID=A0ABQ2P4H4_9NEIS|nr:DUF4236 domain-containing protein [Silvimonas iriomotensis]GGP18140.1 hypothetical protein GCM10010970_03380 [Silvimonas iriomotensis]